ncbi:leucine-rich repeat domain-containing protein [Limnoglobus roseus]|uniref:Leucine-rich repeat domain protein n=1 Tax=Limnoglobus roseus TaxID=2598579 RepID=A0A5C1ADI4_9BACT|nr:hypothetical protein [Limnoglobus roseus]QEL16695.1 leucine-rich repeat domain protein [Limnoglobus roseus]
MGATIALLTCLIAHDPTEAEAVTALERLGARINGADGPLAASRPIRGVLFPKKGCDVKDADLAHLKAIPTLEYVYIIGQKQVTGDGLKYLAGLKKLDTIDLDGTPVEGKHLAHVKDMKQLLKLGLWRTAVDDAGMAHLKGLTSLEHLYLDKTLVGDKGIEALGQHASLCDVSCEGSKVTDVGTAFMKKNFPRYGLPALHGD